MPKIEELQPLLTEPREELGVEYKDWLNLSENEDKAKLAKAAIALANFGGGFVVLGMSEEGGSFSSKPRPKHFSEPTQDAVNAAVRRYASPEFHCEAYPVLHPETGVSHVIVSVPGGIKEPVMSRRECANC